MADLYCLLGLDVDLLFHRHVWTAIHRQSIEYLRNDLVNESDTPLR